MKTLTILTTLALAASSAFATSASSPEASDVFQLEPVIVEASRLPTVQQIANEELESNRSRLNQASRQTADHQVAEQLDQQVAADLGNVTEVTYHILPASYRPNRVSPANLPLVL